jgi:diguanylate cyclase (GGDEF)-like protein
MRQISAFINPRTVGTLLAALTALYAGIVAFSLNDSGLWQTIDVPMYTALEYAAALFCLARAVLRPENRGIWLAIGLGILSFAVGDTYYSYVLPDGVSVADAGYIGLYPCIYLGLGLLLRRRTLDENRSIWLDGAIAGLTMAAVAAAVLFPTIVDTTGGDFWTILVNLSYPLGDVGLMVLALATLGLTGWQIDRVWACALAGCAVFAVTDTVFLWQTAQDAYVQGTILDAGWVVGLMFFAMAAWQPKRPIIHRRLEGFRMLVIPVTFGLLSLAMLVVDHFRRLDTAALVFSTLAISAVIGRMVITFRENTQLLARSRIDAETDSLTGLANRRKLLADLEERVTAGAPTLLALFDLDGFKSYNDAFGHPAGDALLRRLAMNLAEGVAPYGRAYRMGGDEFCLLADLDAVEQESVLRSAAAALREEGEGFHIGSAFGAVLIPEETGDASDALRLADTRMYGHKDSRRVSAVRQSKDVLLTVLHERDGELGGHLTGVAALARSVGRRLGLAASELHDLELTAELHDVGKLAVPDSILSKPGPLSEEEWPFIFRHTLVGERILASAPSLVRIGRLVRSTHERMDGQGYPDGLSGEDIPRISRIVSACDAFLAMTEGRPYRQAIPSEEAVAELRRCAGTHFDPEIVEALIAVHQNELLERVA